MKRLVLGLLFCAWLYGVPFLFIVGLIRRTSAPYLATRAEAERFGATTDAFLIAALVLNLVLPAAGALLARLLREPYWRRHFGWALVGMALIFVTYASIGSEATAPVIGHVPADQEPPPPPVYRCVPISGGRGCPGG